MQLDISKDKHDKRSKVSSAMLETHPYKCIGLVLVNRTGRPSFFGTGFLISPDLVATVAHNLRD
jgi:V8-like Glu-specific endopeptidase